MKHEKIDSNARVWIVTRGADGRLQEAIDSELIASLQAGQSYEDIADALVVAAGTAEIAQTRAW
ncbi:MAG: hypothetical protein ACJ8D5_00440 [Sphingomicrobium sp.]